MSDKKISYREVFPNKLSFLAVIHCEKDDPEHAMRNADIAFNAGADGVWLINHGPDFRASDLVRIYAFVRAEFPFGWIGLNFLGTKLEDVMQFILPTPSINGVWIDNSCLSQIGPGITSRADNFLVQKQEWPGLYFGGTIFKYTGHDNDDPAEAAKKAMPYIDVITTSGPGTGSAPLTAKLKAMREAIEDFPLANASGNSIENVESFGRYANCLITATSLLQENKDGGPDEFDPNKIYEMAQAVAKFNSKVQI